MLSITVLASSAFADTQATSLCQSAIDKAANEAMVNGVYQALSGYGDEMALNELPASNLRLLEVVTSASKSCQ